MTLAFEAKWHSALPLLHLSSFMWLFNNFAAKLNTRNPGLLQKVWITLIRKISLENCWLQVGGCVFPRFIMTTGSRWATGESHVKVTWMAEIQCCWTLWNCRPTYPTLFGKEQQCDEKPLPTPRLQKLHNSRNFANSGVATPCNPAATNSLVMLKLGDTHSLGTQACFLAAHISKNWLKLSPLFSFTYFQAAVLVSRRRSSSGANSLKILCKRVQKSLASAEPAQ